jgi:hypothetical protein
MKRSLFLDPRQIVKSAIGTQDGGADILLLARNLRARAEEALLLAENMSNPRTRQTMRGAAATFEKLAQQLERHAGDNSPGGGVIGGRTTWCGGPR